MFEQSLELNKIVVQGDFFVLGCVLHPELGPRCISYDKLQGRASILKRLRCQALIPDLARLAASCYIRSGTTDHAGAGTKARRKDLDVPMEQDNSSGFAA